MADIILTFERRGGPVPTYTCKWCKLKKGHQAFYFNPNHSKRDTICRHCRNREERERKKVDAEARVIRLAEPELKRIYQLSAKEQQAVKKAARAILRKKRDGGPDKAVKAVTADVRRQSQLLSAASFLARSMGKRGVK